MKIEGVVTVEGVELHVNIEAPDDERELWVTNIHPSCLVIPRERWRVEYLGLPLEVLKECKNQGIASLDDLLSEQWKVDLKKVQKKLSVSAIAHIEQATHNFLEIALVFDMPRQYPEVNVQDVIHQNGKQDNSQKNTGTLDASIEVLELPVMLRKTLERHLKVKTIRELVALDRDQLIMTPDVDEKSIRRIEAALNARGLYL